jgi:hypothetical protein
MRGAFYRSMKATALLASLAAAEVPWAQSLPPVAPSHVVMVIMENHTASVEERINCKF